MDVKGEVSRKEKRGKEEKRGGVIKLRVAPRVYRNLGRSV